MAKENDVYRTWLGITETARPLNYYQLLRLPQFEDNGVKIRAHCKKMSDHVQKFTEGEHAGRAKELLAELTKAMLCLTDQSGKRDYDESIGRDNVGELQHRSFEEILLANKTVDEAQLKKARSFADAVGLELRDAVLQQKLATPDVVMLAYAESIGVSFVDLESVEIDEQLVPQIPPNTARQHSCVPVMIDRGQLLMASPNPLVPDVEEDLRLRLDMPIRTVLCTTAQINTFVAKYYPRDAVEPAAPTAKTKSKSKKGTPEAAPLTLEEKTKAQRSAAILTFNITVIAVMLGLGFVTDLGIVSRIFLAILLGTSAAAGAFFVKK